MRMLVVIAALLLAPAAGAQPTISLNGVPIDGAVSQRIDNATVVIDEKGNVNIIARGYAVARPEGEGARSPAAAPPAAPPLPGPSATPVAASAPVAAPPPRPPPAGGDARPPLRRDDKLTRRYFLVAEQTERGITEYDVAVFVNGRWVSEVRSDAEQDPFEVTKFLNPGANRVTLVASKRAGEVRRSTSREATLRVVIGEGSAGGGQLLLEVPLVQMVRSAAEVETFTEEHTLVAR